MGGWYRQDSARASPHVTATSNDALGGWCWSSVIHFRALRVANGTVDILRGLIKKGQPQLQSRAWQSEDHRLILGWIWSLQGGEFEITGLNQKLKQLHPPQELKQSLIRPLHLQQHRDFLISKSLEWILVSCTICSAIWRFMPFGRGYSSFSF